MRHARPFHSRLLLLAGCSTLLAFSLTACKSNSSAPIVNNAAADPGGPDPANANLAGQPTQVMGQSQSYTPQQQGQSYAQYSQQSYPAGQQAPAPIVQGNSGYSQQGYVDNSGYNGQASYDQGYTDGEVAEAATAPPPLPVYDQPPAPDPNDIWTPGYWNYADTGYYWVPGAWVAAPYYGALWTPPYWGWYGNRYRFHHGYWGPHIGYYGGIDYGFGYIGVGYYGGYWRGHDFYYNRAVNRVGPGFNNVYERNVVVNNVTYNRTTINRISYNGGPGGINAQPRPFELAAARERHEGPLPGQVALRQAAATNRGNFFAANGGRPAEAAVVRTPAAFGGVVGRPGEPGRPGNPGVQPMMNRPNEVGNRPGPGGQPFNRPNEVGNHVGAPGNSGNHGAPGAQPFNRPNEVGNRPGAPGNPGGFNRSGGEPAGRPGGPGNPAINHGAEPGNRPGGFNGPGNRNPSPAPAPQHIGQPASGGFNRPGGEPAGRPAGNPGGDPNGGFNHPAFGAAQHANAPAPQHVGAPQQHMEAPHAALMPQQHMEAPHMNAPQQHMEAPRPAAAPAPHMEAPHGPPALGGGHPGGGGGGPHGPR